MASGAPFVLINPTGSKRPASYFATRTKPPQHGFNGHVVLFGVRSISALTSPNHAPCASPSDHGSPRMPCQLLLPPKNAQPLLCASFLSPLKNAPQKSSQNAQAAFHHSTSLLQSTISAVHSFFLLRSTSGCGLLAPNPGRRGFSCSASF